MKKIFVLLTLIMAVIAGCKKEQLATIRSDVKAPEVLSPAVGTAYIVTPADSTQRVSIKWNKADYGVQAVISYFVQIDSAGRNFKTKINLANTGADTLSLTLGNLNSQLLNALHLTPNVLSTIELRTGATIYGKDSVFSKPVKLSFTTYKELAPDHLYVPGAYQGWNPAAAPILNSVTTFTYEGYVYMSSGGEFKFTTAPDFTHINYGNGGAGKLSDAEPGPSLTVATKGYYKLNADIKNLTYSISLIQSFGVIGTATPHLWDASIPMTFDVAKGIWSVTLHLTPGALKFRANDDWGINYGPADSNALTGSLIQTDNAISIVQDGNYTVTMDMRQSAQKKYLYTVIKN